MKQDSYTLADLLIRLTGIEKGDPACRQIQVKKVIYDREKHLVKMKLSAGQPFHLKTIENVLAEVQKHLDLKDKIETVFTTDTLIEDVDRLRSAEYLEENLQYILSSNFPAAGFIKESFDWQITDEGTLQLRISDPLIFNKANARRLNEEVSRMINSVYGCTLRCAIVKTEEIDFDEHLYREEQAARENAMFNDLMSTQNMKTGAATPAAKKKPARQNQNGSAWVGKSFSGTAKPIGSLTEEDSQVIIRGDVFAVDVRVLKNGKKLFALDLTDYTGSITAKIFETARQKIELDDLIKAGITLMIKGSMQYDHYNKEQVLMVSDIMPEKNQPLKDEAPEKRIEFHCHTNMSQMDGISPVSKLVQQAAEWGHAAVAVTDHGVVQAFPEAAEAGKEYGIRILYGMEGYLVDDHSEIVETDSAVSFDDRYVVFDIETTGLSNAHDRITEIGAVMIEGGEVVSEFTTLVNPERPISSEITKLTGITDEMVAQAPVIADALPEFIQFCQGAVLVAHNAEFDIGFIRENLRKLGCEFDYTILDTLRLSRILLKNLKRHKLTNVAKALHVKLDNHHRAIHDARATAEIFLKLKDLMAEKDIHDLAQMNEKLGRELEVSRLKPYHIVLIAKNEIGLRHLYELVSTSHMTYFHKKPLIPKSLLQKTREGLLIGNACQAGELFQALLQRAPEEKLESIARFYDYLEIQPIGNNEFLIDKGMVQDQNELMDLNRKIVAIGEKLNVPVLATGDSHYIRRTDDLYRQVLQAGMGYEDTEDSANLHFKQLMKCCMSLLTWEMIKRKKSLLKIRQPCCAY
jgi:DNA polymerase III subunit alpha, Gram-positive type